MNFEYNEDQRVFKDSVSKFLQGNYSFDSRQATVANDQPFNKEVWTQCAELGWLYLPFSEAQGGIGGTAVDTMLLFEELGHNLVIEPFLETLILFGGILRRVENPSAEEQLDPIMNGKLQGAVAHFESQSRGVHQRIKSKAEPCDHGYLLNGHKAVVYNAPAADFIVVSARLPAEAEIGLFLVPTKSEGLTLVTYPTVDGRSAAEVMLTNVVVSNAHLLVEGDAANVILESVYNEALLALTAEMVGSMEALLTATVEYTKERKQFGTRLSKFQVLQHHMSDMYMAGEVARSLMYAAAIKLREGDADASAFIAAAKAKADKSAKLVAHSAIQLHGGIATTEELKVGHYLKRITIATQLFGSTQYHVKRYSQLMSSLDGE